MGQTRNSKIKKHFRHYKPLYAVILVQILIVLLFAESFSNAIKERVPPLDVSVIVVEDVCYKKGISRYYVSVYSNAEEYIFPGSGYYTYPNGKLFDAIAVGDKLTISYFSKKTLFGYKKVILGAYTENKVLRSVEEYERGYDSVWILELVGFVVIETLFLLASAGILWANNLFKIRKKKKQ